MEMARDFIAKAEAMWPVQLFTPQRYAYSKRREQRHVLVFDVSVWSNQVWVPRLREALHDLAPAFERAAAARGRSMMQGKAVDTAATRRLITTPVSPGIQTTQFGNESLGFNMETPPKPLITQELIDATTNYAVRLSRGNKRFAAIFKLLNHHLF